LEPPADTWRYLGFYFDRKLTFRAHVKFYATKALTTVKAMAMLGNSSRGINPSQKRLLYRSFVVPLATYGARLWNFKGAKNKTIMLSLTQMQRKAALWITGAFKTSPTGAVEMLAGLPPIHLHIKILLERDYARTRTLIDSHPTLSLIKERHGLYSEEHNHPTAIDNMTHRVWVKTRSPIMDIEYGVDTCTEQFIPTHFECTPGRRIVDLFENRIHQNIVLGLDEDGLKARKIELDGIYTAATNEFS